MKEEKDNDYKNELKGVQGKKAEKKIDETSHQKYT